MSRKLIAHQPIDIVKPLMAWFKGAAHRRTLADMPEYLLKDIGLHRDEQGGVAGYAADATPVQTPAPEAPASAKVVPFAPSRPGGKPSRPQKPLAA